MWSIYKHTFPNNKVYIGLTKQPHNQRFRNGLGYESCPLMNNAINKYGWSNVVTDWLETELTTLEEACQLEQYYIKLYKSNQSEYGYNLANGGQGGATNLYDHQAIINCWNEGFNTIDIIKKFGCSSTTVRRVLDEYNVPSIERRKRQNMRDGKTVYVYDRQKILELYNNNCSVVDICKKLGCSRGTVRNALNEANIPLKEREERRVTNASKTLKTKYNKELN